MSNVPVLIRFTNQEQRASKEEVLKTLRPIARPVKSESTTSHKSNDVNAEHEPELQFHSVGRPVSFQNGQGPTLHWGVRGKFSSVDWVDHPHHNWPRKTPLKNDDNPTIGLK